MKSVLIAPRKYVQGRGVLCEIGRYAKMLGGKPMILWDAVVKDLVGPTVLESLQGAGLEAVPVDFQGEATKEECERVAAIVRETGADISIGVGGGKVLDIAKAVSVETGSRLMTCPTIASTDSPTSAATVWYDTDGKFCGFDCWPFNPDVVLVDSQIIAGGPVRAFAAGMGDALSTWVETEAAFKTRAPNLSGGKPTLVAVGIARLCFDTLIEHGVAARRAVELNLVTPSVEKVIEANTLMSGLGFESGGLATAHMVANLLSNQPECAGIMHGEKVGFGIATQLCLDDDTEIDEMYFIFDFMIAIGLPVTLGELGLDGVGRERLKEIADVCAGEGSLCANHNFEVTSESVLDAMIAADAVGRERKSLAE